MRTVKQRDDLFDLRLGRQHVALGPSSPRALLGRDDETCDLSASLPAISRRHAEVAVLDGKPHLRDLGSSNGTWINGQPVGTDWVPLRPGQAVHLGEQPIELVWPAGAGSTIVEAASQPLAAAIAERKAQLEAAAEQPLAPDETLRLAAVAELPYRWEGETASGRLLLALSGDTFQSGGVVDGATTFTAFDDAKVASILVELIEKVSGKRSRRAVWDRSIVREGPWRATPNERLTAAFQLELPRMATPSSPEAEWEVRGLVDINWASDIKTGCMINVRNVELDRLAQALVALGADLEGLDPVEAGVRFQQSLSLAGAAKLIANSDSVELDVEVKDEAIDITFTVKRLFGSNRQSRTHLSREALRTESIDGLAGHLEATLGALS